MEQVTSWKTADGKTFENEKDAVEHEEQYIYKTKLNAFERDISDFFSDMSVKTNNMLIERMTGLVISKRFELRKLLEKHHDVTTSSS